MSDYSAFVGGLRKAFEHTGGIKTLCLGEIDPAWFAAIQREVREIIENAPSSDVTQKGHVTNWTRPKGKVQQFSLFNSSGNSGDYTGDYGALEDTKKKRLVFPEKAAIARFAALFGGRLRSLRLNGMGPSSGLNAHEEVSISATPTGPRFITRFHLPIVTNDKAWMFLDGERFQYREGKLYFFNHGCVHAGNNESDVPRYHFVLDCFLNRPLFENVISPAAVSPDAGFKKYTGTDRELIGTPHHFADFTSEDGKIRTGEIAYGRRAPGYLSYWQKNYPSVFGKAA